MLANRWVRSGVVSGRRTEPVKFREYWTFTRPVGDHPWKLSAINQAE
jgi:predicted lipid-binding transport protein (Tim44 family)